MPKNKFFLFIYLGYFIATGFLNCFILKASPNDITIYLNNNPLVSPSSPFIEKGITLVPMRLIFEALGADVAWSAETQTIIAKKGSTNITLSLGNKTAFVDISKKTLLAPPILRNGTTYVPLRFISESLGAHVDWSEIERSIYISSNNLSSFPVPPTAPASSQSAKELTVQEIGRLENTIVFVYNQALDGNDSFGSGFIISEDGKIVTNYHVIANAKKLIVTLDNDKEYSDISILGYDIDKDIAILKINSTGKFPYCELGDSNKVVLGDSIVVIGNPMGLRNTLSTGIVSSLKQKGFIQITAPISPGSSGGALFNMSGEVIGITSASIIQGQNLGFCIPINDIKNISLGNPLSLEAFNKVGNTLDVPKDVRAFPLSANEIAIQWEYDPNVDYYYVYYSETADGKFSPFVDEYNQKKKFDWYDYYSVSHYDLSAKTTIYYKVTAVKNGAESSFSQIASASTLQDNSSISIDIVKEGSLNQFPSKKIGTHMNRFFKNPHWTYFYSLENEDIVEFTGSYIYKNKHTKILLQFLVNPSLKTFKVVYLERDDKALSYEEYESLMNQVFQ